MGIERCADVGDLGVVRVEVRLRHACRPTTQAGNLAYRLMYAHPGTQSFL